MNSDYDYLYDPFTRSLWDHCSEHSDPEPFDVEGDIAGMFEVPPTVPRTQGDGWCGETVEGDEPRVYDETDNGEDTI